MNRTEFELRCEADGRCRVKTDSEASERRFPDLLAALAFIHDHPEVDGAALVVYDPKGKVTLRAEL